MNIYVWLYLSLIFLSVFLWMLFHLCSRGLDKLHEHGVSVQIGLYVDVSHNDRVNLHSVWVWWKPSPLQTGVASMKETIGRFGKYIPAPPTEKCRFGAR